jgi:hypothetical protein
LSNLEGVGRKRINEEQMPARVRGGTLARIDAVRLEKETRAEFVRVAIENELERREQRRPTPRTAGARKK